MKGTEKTLNNGDLSAKVGEEKEPMTWEESAKESAELRGKVKKEQKVSESYTIKAFAKHITNMKKAKMITDEEFKQLKDMHVKIMNRWIGGNMFEE